MRIEQKEGSHGNELVVVVFEPDSNFNPYDLTWTPRKEELNRIYRAMKRARAWK